MSFEVISYIQYIKGHKNSKGESAPWVIRDHKTGKILSSHKSREEAEKHLKRMKYFKHKRKASININPVDIIKAEYQFLKDLIDKNVISEKDLSDKLLEIGQSMRQIAIDYLEGEINKEEAEKQIKDLITSEYRNTFKKYAMDMNIQSLIEGINAEYEAIQLYESLKQNCTDEMVRKIFEDVIKEEKTHIGEFQKALKDLDYVFSESLQEGEKEVEEIKQEYTEYPQQEPLKDMLDYGKSLTAAAKFKFDPNSTENEGRFRLRDPRDFDDKTFRRWKEWAGVRAPKGVSFIVGNLKNSKKKALQSIRFDRTIWDEEKAGKLWENLKDKPGFQKTWVWDKKVSFAIYTPMSKIAQMDNSVQYVDPKDNINIVYLKNEPDFENLKETNKDLNTFVFITDWEQIDDINPFISKLRGFYGPRLKGLICPLCSSYFPHKLEKFKQLFKNLSCPLYVHMKEPSWYNPEVVDFLKQNNIGFVRDDFELGKNYSNEDFYYIEIKDKEDVKKLKEFIEDFEKNDVKNKHIFIEYRGVDKEILKELEEIYQLFQEKFNEKIEEIKQEMGKEAVYEEDSINAKPYFETELSHGFDMDEIEDLNRFRRKPELQDVFEEYITTIYPEKIDYEKKYIDKTIDEMTETDYELEKKKEI